MHIISPGVEFACSGGVAPSTEMLNVRAFEDDVQAVTLLSGMCHASRLSRQRYTNQPTTHPYETSD